MHLGTSSICKKPTNQGKQIAYFRGYDIHKSNKSQIFLIYYLETKIYLNRHRDSWVYGERETGVNIYTLKKEKREKLSSVVRAHEL